MAALQTSLQIKNTFIELSSPPPTFRRSRTSGSIIGLQSLTDSGSTTPDAPNTPDLMSPGNTTASDLMSPGNTTASDMMSPGTHPRKSKFLDAYVASMEKSDRTTVMIRGIPKSYDQDMLLAEVTAQGFAVNFLYLPPGKTKSNRSYGFVNFENEFVATMFIYMFEGHRWYYEPAAKRASVGFALLQGYEQNIEFYSIQNVTKGVAHRSPWIRYSKRES